WRLRARRVMKGVIGATKVDVVIGAGKKGVTEFEAGHGHGHGHDDVSLTSILERLRRAKLPAVVRDRAVATFLRLGDAEARVHRTTLKGVHFHEVGAIDSVVDITGGILALHLLGVERVTASPFPLSHGHIHCRHGVLPVPGPATLEIVRGAPTVPLDVDGETLTPTGAALIRTLAEGYGPPPPMTVEAVGYGAGDSDFPERPNVLRLVLGAREASEESDSVWVVETNLDHVSPEVVGYAVERCFAAGAVDAWTAPIQMKKGRPGVLLSAIVPPEALAAVEEVFFQETATLGVRRHLVDRSKLAREFVSVKTRFGEIHVKVGSRDGRLRTASPEYEDCRRAAERAGAPLRVVYDEALAAFRGRRPR
ncbi:MAG: nickel pincer cofactor biosynthesis protein LarC, partial [Planctomycetes bacterium]|nr:nickel pincer cofactor biosynthesis protein LarC [Planctomycetota bacterium]